MNKSRISKTFFRAVTAGVGAVLTATLLASGLSGGAVGASMAREDGVSGGVEYEDPYASFSVTCTTASDGRTVCQAFAGARGWGGR